MKSKREIISIHISLLFKLGYSESENSFLETQKEMLTLCESVKKLSAAKKEKLIGSGIAFTETQGSYSFSLIKWLLERFPKQISLHSLDEAGVHPKEIFKHVLPEMEFELVSDEKFGQLFITDTHTERVKEIFKNIKVPVKCFSVKNGVVE